MRRLALVWAGLATALLVAFALGESFGIGALTHPGDRLDAPSAAAAVLGVGLLVADVVLPVPSSVVMVALGAAFGPATGAALSVAGGVGSLCVAGLLGRRCQALVGRLLGDDRERAEALVDRYGATAVLASRPVPVLAESVALVAAAGGMPAGRFLAAGVAGSVPVGVLYAVAGARGTQADGVVLAAAVIALAGLALVAGRRVPASVRA